MVLPVCVSAMMILPSLGHILVPLAGISFLLSVVVFFLSFLATPYRLGSLFLWP